LLFFFFFIKDISDHLPLILSYKKTSPDGFIKSPPCKKIKWSSQICRDKYKSVFPHNKFTYLVNEFEYNDNLDSQAIIKETSCYS